ARQFRPSSSAHTPGALIAARSGIARHATTRKEGPNGIDREARPAARQEARTGWPARSAARPGATPRREERTEPRRKRTGWLRRSARRSERRPGTEAARPLTEHPPSRQPP